jgi:hypothetical protein
VCSFTHTHTVHIIAVIAHNLMYGEFELSFSASQARACPVTCVVKYYLTSPSYIVCQTDTLRLFRDSPARNMFLKSLINYFHHRRSVKDKNCFSRTSVLKVRDRLLRLLLKSLGKLDQRSELSYGKTHTYIRQ